MCWIASDALDHKGMAYGTGEVGAMVLVSVAGDKGTSKAKRQALGSKVAKTLGKLDDVARAAESKLDDVAFGGDEAVKIGGVAERATDAEKAISKIDEIEVKFNYKTKYDEAEFARQLAEQEAGMNKLTVDEYLKNRERYIAEGRAVEGNMAQKVARENAYLDKVTEFRRNGLSHEQAKIKAQEWMDT